jgi:hypothetical protein
MELLQTLSQLQEKLFISEATLRQRTEEANYFAQVRSVSTSLKRNETAPQMTNPIAISASRSLAFEGKPVPSDEESDNARNRMMLGWTDLLSRQLIRG